MALFMISVITSVITEKYISLSLPYTIKYPSTAARSIGSTIPSKKGRVVLSKFIAATA